MAQQSILITQVGSTGQTPTQYTAQSPSLARYRMTSTIIDYGDQVSAANAGGIVGAGFINVEYHNNNQWKTETLFTTQNGAAIKTLIEA